MMKNSRNHRWTFLLTARSFRRGHEHHPIHRRRCRHLRRRRWSSSRSDLECALSTRERIDGRRAMTTTDARVCPIAICRVARASVDSLLAVSRRDLRSACGRRTTRDHRPQTHASGATPSTWNEETQKLQLRNQSRRVNTEQSPTTRRSATSRESADKGNGNRRQ